MSLATKILIPCAIVILVGAGWWFYGRYVEIGAIAHKAESERVASYIESRAEPYITSGAFLSTDETKRTEAFETFFKEIQSPDIFRVKIWTKDYTILWSDLQDIIGNQYSDNAEVASAYQGNIVLSIGQPKLEHISERQVVQLLEVYVPVRDLKGDISLVVETYAVGEELSSEASTLLAWKGLAALLGAILLIALLGFVLRRFVR